MGLIEDKPERNLFLRGETVTLDIEEIDTEKSYELTNKGTNYELESLLKKRRTDYRIIQYAGSGLAASVWKAVDSDSGKEVALKIYNPRGLSGMIKRFIRKIAHLLVFQSPFPYRYIKEAVLTNAVAGDILAEVIENEMGKPLVARSRAVFFSPTHSSYGEVVDWAEGKKGFENNQERKDVLGALRLFREISQKAGFTEHLYQVADRFGGPAQTYRNIIRQTTDQFIWVDRTPALPIVLFIYPYHFAAIIKALKRKRLLPLFDKVDTSSLREYIENNMNQRRRELNLVRLRLYERLHKEYAASRIDLLTRLANGSSDLGWKVKKTYLNYWQESHDISPKSATTLENSGVLFKIFAILDLIPFAGRFSRKMFLNSDTWKHIKRLLWPVFRNEYRIKRWDNFKQRSIKKVTAWLLEDVKKMYDRGKISFEQLQRFEESTKTKEWLTYIWVFIWYGAGKIPGDYLAAALGGYALFDIFKMVSSGDFYFSTPVIIGAIGVFIPGVYRIIVTLIVAGKNPDVKFKWYWIVFSGIPSFGYLAMPFQILAQNLSNKAVWTLLGLKLHSNISNLLDIIPGYRELDFYILSRLIWGRKAGLQSINARASAENQ